MKKLNSTFINMIISLTLVSLVAGVSLAFMNEITKEPKAEARKQKKIMAIKSVLNIVNNNPFEEKISFGIGEKDSLDFYIGRNNDYINGIAISTFSNKGYNGLIKLMVGFDVKGEIIDISVLFQKETPGLGTKMNTKSFLNQYRGKNPSKWKVKVKKDGGETDAITGATISSRAFNDAVQKAYVVFEKEIDGIK